MGIVVGRWEFVLFHGLLVLAFCVRVVYIEGIIKFRFILTKVL